MRQTKQERAARQRVYRLAHLEEYRAWNRAYYAAHRDDPVWLKGRRDSEKRWKARRPERVALQTRAWKYGVSIEKQNTMLERQGYCCAICFLPFRDASDTHLDHNPDTGLVRGFLCGKCNRALGVFNDSIDHLMAAVRYLEES